MGWTKRRCASTCSTTFNIEIGAGLGPLAGKIWRIGLMGASSSPRLVLLLVGALEARHGAARVEPVRALTRVSGRSGARPMFSAALVAA